MENIRKVNSEIKIIPVSSKVGTGLDEWVDWILEGRKAK